MNRGHVLQALVERLMGHLSAYNICSARPAIEVFVTGWRWLLQDMLKGALGWEAGLTAGGSTPLWQWCAPSPLHLS